MSYSLPLQHYNLSRNKSFRSLETTASSIVAAGDTAPSSLRAVLCTIASPVFLDIIIVYQDSDVDSWVPFRSGMSLITSPVQFNLRSLNKIITYGPYDQQLFEVLREMHGAREFQLVLCLDVLDFMVERGVQALERLVKAGKMGGKLDYLVCNPLVIAETRAPRARPALSMGCPFSASWCTSVM